MGKGTTLAACLVVGALVSAAAAQDSKGLAVGDDAPPVLAAEWLNTEGGGSPLSAGRADDQVMMLEFWGTWCGPCVRAMPEVQALHERYREQGVLVVAITREGADVAQPFLEKNGYSMAVACDTSQDTIRAFEIKSWPTTYVIDREGVISYVGGPTGAKSAVEKALGLEGDAGSVLVAYMETLSEKDDAVQRAALELLIEKSRGELDLVAWATGNGGAAAEKVVKKAPEDLLDRCVNAWKRDDAAKKQAALDAVVASGVTEFDLNAWARTRLADEYPLGKAELEELLAAKAYGVVIDALLDRNPSGAVLGVAKKDDGLVAHCRSKAQGAFTLARKGVMCVEYAFQTGRLTEETNSAFWADLSVNGIATSKDEEGNDQLAGVVLGGAMVSKEEMSDFVDRNLARYLLMDAIGNGGKLKLSGIPKSAAKERTRIVKALDRKYG